MTERKLDPFVKCDDPIQRELLRKHLPRVLNKLKKENPLGFMVMSKTQIAIFNIDGTVSDDTWRRSFIQVDDKSHYHERCHFDLPVKGIKERLADLRRKGVKIVFFTERPISYWDQTRDWIKAYFKLDVTVDYELFMRPVAAPVDDLTLKKLIIRTIRDRIHTEIFAVYDHDSRVLTMARNEGVYAFPIDAEEGDVNYLKETVKPSGEAENAFMVKAEDFAVKATGAVGSVAEGYFTIPRPPVVHNIGEAPFFVNLGENKTLSQLREEGLETLRQQTEKHQHITVDPKDRKLTEVEAQWLSDAQAAHIAERALNFHGRTAKEFREIDNAVKLREEAVNKFAENFFIPTATASLDDMERHIGITPEERKAYDRIADICAPLTAQEAACDAAKSFFKGEPVKSNSERLGDVLSDLEGVRTMSSEMSALFEFFFPHGVRMSGVEDYQFTSILMTVCYALSRFIKGGMSDATDLQATVLHLAALEPLIANHTVEALDEEDDAS